MSKELEALNYVWYNYYTEELSQDEVEQIEKNLNIVQDGLKRLESIDNSQPSTALECLERVGNYVDKDYDYCQRGDYDKDYNIIKRALLNKSQKELAFEKIQEILDTYYTSYIMDNESALRRIDKIIREVSNNE